MRPGSAVVIFRHLVMGFLTEPINAVASGFSPKNWITGPSTCSADVAGAEKVQLFRWLRWSLGKLPSIVEHVFKSHSC